MLNVIIKTCAERKTGTAKKIMAVLIIFILL